MRYAHGLNIGEHVNCKVLAVENKAGRGIDPQSLYARSTDKSTNLGFSVLRRMDVPTLESTYWINASALLGFIFLFNILFTMSLMFIEALGKPQAIISEEEAAARNAIDGDANGASIKGMVLPFTPLAMSFDNMNYYVDMPSEMREQGVTEDRLQLLRDVTGAFNDLSLQ
ncbi:ABC transporter G family member 35-like protein [Tanacetum coccineum]